MHVRVDQAGQEHAAGEVHDLVVRAGRAHPREGAAVDDHARFHGDPGVGLGTQPPPWNGESGVSRTVPR